MTTQEMVNLGVQRLRAREYDEAQNICRQILQLQADHPDALHMLAAVAHKKGDYKTALELTERAIATSPNRGDFYVGLGLTLQSLGRTHDAVAAYRTAAELAPDLPQTHNNLGLALANDGKIDEAIACYLRARSIAPGYADPPYNLGNAYMEQGKHERAIAEYRAALALRPDWVVVLNNLGVAHRMRDEYAPAADCYSRALAAAPDFVMAWNNLGDVLIQQRQHDRAAAACRRALELEPNLADAHNNLGLALCSLGQFADAIASLKTALALRPQFAEACNNLANAYHWSGDWEQALAMYRRAIELKPDYPMPRWNVGLIHLIHGEFERGWPEYEWRTHIRELRITSAGGGMPKWDGSPLNGRRILVHCEQGLGDTIQFIRYLPMIAQRGGRVVLSCQKELLELLRSQGGDYECVAAAESNPPQPDVRIALPSLPGIFATNLETIPHDVPYLKADPASTQHWRTRLADDGRRKIGLAWAGSRQHPQDMQRSMRLDQFAPLTESGARLISLQKGDAAAQPATVGFKIDDWTPELADFSDTAALIQNLDLVITVDTAVAHLAAALGKPVWVLITFVPDWRWMLGREDSPWYPTMRLFRQERCGDWTAPLGKIAAAMKQL